MSIAQLEHILLEEQSRDKRKTFLVAELIYLILFLIFILCANLFIIILRGTNLCTYISENYSTSSLSFNLIFLILMLGFFLFPLYYLKRSNQRKSEITRLISYLKIGSRAHTVEMRRKYKINISFGSKSLKLFPVTMLYVIVDKDNRPFRLPVRETYISEISPALSKGFQ